MVACSTYRQGLGLGDGPGTASGMEGVQKGR